jgi:hypothetical protein
MLLFMYFVIEDHDILFVLSEVCHLIGLAVLLYKLHQKKSAAGAALSMRISRHCMTPQAPSLLRQCSHLLLGLVARWKLFAAQSAHLHHLMQCFPVVLGRAEQ